MAFPEEDHIGTLLSGMGGSLGGRRPGVMSGVVGSVNSAKSAVSAATKKAVDASAEATAQKRFGIAPAPVTAGQGAAPVPAAAAAMPHVGIPDEEQSRIRSAGGDPAHFQMWGNQLMSARSPEAINADYAAHPPITTAAGHAIPKLAAPAAAVPSVGVQGAAPAQAAKPGVQAQAAQVDPTRAAMERNYRIMANGGIRSGPNSITYPNQADWTAEQYSAHHGALAAQQNALANYNQTAPDAKMALLHGIAHADPATRGVGLASMNPSIGPADIPRPGFDVDPASGMDINQWLAANKGTSLQGKLASVPHAPSPIVRDALQRHIDSEYSAPGAWEAEASQLPGMGDYQYHGIAPSFLAGPSNIASYLWDRTPFGGQERNANPEMIGLMKKHGLRPPGVNMPSSQQGIGNPN